MTKGTVKNLSNMEIDMMINGTTKTIKELQEETKNRYPAVVTRAIQNDLADSYMWRDELINERNRRTE